MASGERRGVSVRVGGRAGATEAHLAVILDCVNDRAKAFHKRWDFAELPGHPYRLFLDARTLAAMMKPDG